MARAQCWNDANFKLRRGVAVVLIINSEYANSKIKELVCFLLESSNQLASKSHALFKAVPAPIPAKSSTEQHWRAINHLIRKRGLSSIYFRLS